MTVKPELGIDEIPKADGSVLEGLLRPSSVAIVGASETEGSYPAKVLRNLAKFGYRGEIYPVNPRRQKVFEYPCFPTLAEVPTVPDLVLFMIPASGIEHAVRQACEIGVTAGVIYSSGFAELGGEGLETQQRISAMAMARGMTLLGPNSQGFFHLGSSVVASFSTTLDHGLSSDGSVAYVGQSGALGGAVLGLAMERGIGVSSWFSTGNESGLTATDAAEALLREPNIETIVIHLEAIPDGPMWLTLAERARHSGKSIVCIRSGRSNAGRRAAASHTGAMSRGDESFLLLSRSAGIAVVDDIDTALDVVEASLAPPVIGRRVGIVTTSGGAGGLAADHLYDFGIDVPVLSDATRGRLDALVPSFGSTANPVDVTAQMFAAEKPVFGEVCATVCGDAGIDAVLVVVTNLTGATAREVAEDIVEATADHPAPVQVAWLAPADRIGEAREALLKGGIRVHGSLAAAARSMHYRLSTMTPEAVPSRVLDDERLRLVDAVVAGQPKGVITECRGRSLLELAGIATPSGVLIDGIGDVASAAGLRAPFVVKVQSPDVLHKTEVGGVRLGVQAVDLARSIDEIRTAVAAKVPQASIEGVLVQEQQGPGVDLIVGVRREGDGYPPVVTVGAGGIATELYRDIARAIAPAAPETIHALLKQLKSWPLLQGYRGAAAVAVEAACEGIARLSEIVATTADITEIEINPLRLTPDAAIALDFVAVTRRSDDG
ncbi:acetate--CoA ligase family protein [Aeromicrobium sp. YIM 150415]|uniref:acetate--CoA ligase family protein n=1 Tax=Aeromicrobium sp. YIM 150415 TaxID=2803912 RepID=UPI00196699DC|nr:acetate--CoA ligase family protein [Aeromicrobium sp. YIM 150415]MBM9463583.1 acetate--CoA ligase family protein [Aeromicrobium sp. YIM 150415]